MRRDEVDAYLVELVASYARDLVVQAGLEEEPARRKADEDFARLFPDGLPGEGVEVLALVADGEVVGRVVWAPRDEHGRLLAFLYDIRVDPAQRGRGLGRLALELVEQDVRGRGMDRIALNAFGRNDVARNLYRTHGYEERAVYMTKDLV